MSIAASSRSLAGVAGGLANDQDPTPTQGLAPGVAMENTREGNPAQQQMLRVTDVTRQDTSVQNAFPKCLL